MIGKKPKMITHYDRAELISEIDKIISWLPPKVISNVIYEYLVQKYYFSKEIKLLHYDRDDHPKPCSCPYCKAYEDNFILKSSQTFWKPNTVIVTRDIFPLSLFVPIIRTNINSNRFLHTFCRFLLEFDSKTPSHLLARNGTVARYISIRTPKCIVHLEDEMITILSYDANDNLCDTYEWSFNLDKVDIYVELCSQYASVTIDERD
jgi:hypothetical protein